LPDIVDDKALTWVSEQWEADLAGPTPLTYKGAFYLLSTSHLQAHSGGELIERTITYLEQEQNEDGGFGPWKGHPIGSCPWTTGVVLWGLSKAASKVSSNTVRRAMSWLESKQLPNGLWPYHYLDDATSMVLIGLSSTLPLVIK
jgi:prenyltransferase beta subunit